MKTNDKPKKRFEYKGYPGDDEFKEICKKMNKAGYTFLGGGYNFKSKKYDMTFVKKDSHD